MLALFNKLLDWFRALFWKEEMELTLVGLQYSGKTTFVNVIAVSGPRRAGGGRGGATGSRGRCAVYGGAEACVGPGRGWRQGSGRAGSGLVSGRARCSPRPGRGPPVCGRGSYGP